MGVIAGVLGTEFLGCGRSEFFDASQNVFRDTFVKSHLIMVQCEESDCLTFEDQRHADP